jgi:inner membrane protein
MLKVGSIGFLVLVLLIPLAMTRSLIDDRIAVGNTAKADIQRAWGGSQVIAGPILVVPYTATSVHPYGDRREESGELHFLPAELDIDVGLDPEVRYRGIHEVAVYTATAELTGRFDLPDTSGMGVDDAVFDWRAAYFLFGVSDARAIRNAPALRIDDQAYPFEAGAQHIPGFPPMIVARANLLAAQLLDVPLEFAIQLDAAGTDAFSILPLGGTTTAAISSGWASPSFGGKHLPEVREIDDNGFHASWRISSLGRNLPSRWTTLPADNQAFIHSVFGVSLYTPVDFYHLTDRATKYAVLIVGLTFVAYFLFELLARLRLHPLQYLLIGLANTLFYLLLLSLAEHLGFAWAYFMSAVGATSLIVAYSASILKSRKRASLVGAMLAVLYLFLYLTLNAETYALLAGSIGLWITLALIMYVTRNIDWYGTGRDAGDTSQQGLFDRR